MIRATRTVVWVADSTVRRERGLLQSIFDGIDEGYDIRNPFRGIKRGKNSHGLVS